MLELAAVRLFPPSPVLIFFSLSPSVLPDNNTSTYMNMKGEARFNNLDCFAQVYALAEIAPVERCG